MRNQKLRIGLVLFILRFIGVLSNLTAKLPMNQIPEAVKTQFSETALKILSLINPTVLLVAAIAVSVNLYKKVKLRLPIIEEMVNKESTGITKRKSLAMALV